MKKLLKAIFVITFVTISGFAQNQDERKIIKMPTVEVPFEASMSKLGGIVLAKVTVDRVGMVVSVDNVTGPDWVCEDITRPDVVALRETARVAATEVIFEPRLTDMSDHSQEIVVFDFPRDSDFPNGQKVINFGKKLKKDPISNIDLINNSSSNISRDKRAVTIRSGTLTPTNKGLIPDIQTKGMISGGVMNAKAKHLEVPNYPKAALSVNVDGKSNVQILMDEEGKVFASMAVSGHPLLKPTARMAACKSSFVPITLSGQPVMISGLIVYKFILRTPEEQ